MAEAQNRLRITDFLPSRFQGEVIDSDLARAHYLAFTDYLHAHEIDEPDNEEELQNLVQIFTRTLRGQARLWIEGKEFENLGALHGQFLARFSPSTSYIARSGKFKELVYTKGDTAEVHLSKISKTALPLGYNEEQVRDKFLSTLPTECRSSVLMSSPMNAPLPELVAKVQCYFDLNQMENQAPSDPDLAMNMQSQSMRGEQASSSSNGEMRELCNKIKALEAKLSKQTTERQVPNQASNLVQDERKRNGFDENRSSQESNDFNRRRFRPQYNSNITCYKCGNAGHMARFCRMNAQRPQNGNFQGNFQRPQNGNFQSLQNGDFQSLQNGSLHRPQNGNFQSLQNGNFQHPPNGNFQSLPNRNFPGPEHCPPNEKFQSLESNMNMQASPPLPTQNVMSQTYNMQDMLQVKIICKQMLLNLKLRIFTRDPQC